MTPLDRLLFIYTTIFVTALTIGAVANVTSTKANLLSLLFLLPLFGYLIFQVIVAIYRYRYRLAHPPQPTSPRLQLVNLPQKRGFFRQTQPAFLVTLALFVLTLTSTITLSVLNH